MNKIHSENIDIEIYNELPSKILVCKCKVCLSIKN